MASQGWFDSVCLLGYEEETIVNGLSVAAKVVYSCALTFYY
jgi:hypothetical protein